MRAVLDYRYILRIAPRGYPLPLSCELVRPCAFGPRRERLLRRRAHLFAPWNDEMQHLVRAQIVAACTRRHWNLQHMRVGQIGAYWLVNGGILGPDFPSNLAQSTKRWISLHAWECGLQPKRVRVCSTMIGWTGTPLGQSIETACSWIDYAVACGAI